MWIKVETFYQSQKEVNDYYNANWGYDNYITIQTYYGFDVYLFA